VEDIRRYSYNCPSRYVLRSLPLKSRHVTVTELSANTNYLRHFDIFLQTRHFKSEASVKSASFIIYLFGKFTVS